MTPSGLTALDLADLHLRAMYTIDGRGELLGSNPPNPRPAPVFHLVRTAEGNRWAFRANLDLELRVTIEALLRSEPVDPALAEEPACAGALRTALADAHLEVPTDALQGFSGPAYWLPRPELTPSDVIRITEANSALLDPRLPDMHEDIPSGPLFVALDGGEAIAHCHCARRSPVAAVEAGVRTLEGFRGRGHATRCALAWAAAVYEEGRLPLYSTSWDNVASQAVAGRLDARPYGVDFHLP